MYVRGARGWRGCLSTTHSLWLSFYLSPTLRFFLCVFVSPLITDRHLSSLLYLLHLRWCSWQCYSFCKLIAYVRQSLHAPPFLSSSPNKLNWPATWLTQSQTALKPDGYAWHKISNNKIITGFFVYRRLARYILVVHTFKSVRAWRLSQPHAQRCCRLLRRIHGQPEGPLKSVANWFNDNNNKNTAIAINAAIMPMQNLHY